MEEDQGYKVTSVGTQTCSAANNQAQICMPQFSFSCRHRLCWVILVSSSLAQLGVHWNGNLRVVGLSPLWDLLYISNQKNIYIKSTIYMCTYTIYNMQCIWFMMIVCFCGMVDWRKAVSLISSRHNCQRSSPSRISDRPPAGFERPQNLSSGLVEWSCAAMITTTLHYTTVHIYLSIYLYMHGSNYSYNYGWCCTAWKQNAQFGKIWSFWNPEDSKKLFMWKDCWLGIAFLKMPI